MNQIVIKNIDEWRVWRHAGIGGSDASIIMEVSRFKTPVELWEEKIKDSPSPERPSFITEKGHVLEVRARAKIELELMKEFPATLFEWHVDGLLRCSADGYSGKEILEIKYYGKDKFNALRDDGIIPEEVYPQLQHNMLCSGTKEAILCIVADHHTNKDLNKGEIDITYKRVPYDNRYVREELLLRVLYFLRCVRLKERPNFQRKSY